MVFIFSYLRSLGSFAGRPRGRFLVFIALILSLIFSPEVVSAYSAPTIDNPQLFTYESIAPRVDVTSGALTENIKINVPPGRNGLTPDLSLNYNSQQLQDGPAGYGWTVSIPYIERMNKAGSENLYSRQDFYSSLDGELVSSATTTAATSTISAATGAGDGRTWYSAATWAGAHDHDGSSASVNYTATDNDVRADKVGGTYNITRGYFPFDTSGIPDNATITSATLKFYPLAFGNESALDLYLVESTQAATSSLSNTDYDNVGTTTWSGMFDGNDLTLNTYESLPLNATGTAAISKTGWTKIAMVEKNDLDNSATNETSVTYATIATSEQSGTSADPYLEITYTLPGAESSDSSEFYARIDDGSFRQYLLTDNKWLVTDKNGTTFTFGTTTAARQAATTTPSNVSRWMLEEVRDKNNNYIEYAYTSDGNQIYPSSISYTGHGSTDGPFTVDFTYETRPDTITSYKPGFKVTTTKRLTQIQASVNSSWVRKYALSYSSGVNSTRSLLSSVQETGRDESGNQVSLPAMSFAYSSSTPAYVTHTNQQILNNARVVGDVDGNGLPDMSIFYQNSVNSNTHRVIQENKYPTFTEHSSQVNTEYWSYDVSDWDTYRPTERGTRFFDANGDGKVDIATSDSNNGSPNRQYAEGQGDFSWTSKSVATGTIPMFANSYVSGGNGFTYSSGIFGNANGDGLIDYVISLASCGGGSCDPNGTYLHAATTTGWERATSTYTPIANMPTNGPQDQSNSVLVDINGDGLDDWMQSGDTGAVTNFCLNTGSAWDAACESPWNLATSTRHANGWDRGIRFIDVNGDDLPDYVRSYSMPAYTSNSVPHIEVGSYNYVYLNTGNGFATSTLTVPGTIFNGRVTGSNQWVGTIEYNELVDWNGDGILDHYSQTSTSGKPDILTQVIYPTGGTTSLTHKYTTQLKNASGTLKNPNLAFPLLVVTEKIKQDGFGNTETTNYDYYSGKTYTSGDVLDRRFAGFEITAESIGDIFTKRYFHQGDTASTTVGEATDHFSKIGKTYREDVTASSTGSLYKRTFYNWDSVGIGTTTSRYFLELTKVLEQSYDGDSDHKDKAEAFTYSTTTGNVLTKVEWGEVTGSDDGTYTDTGTDKRTTTYSYATDGSYIVGRTSQETVTNQSDVKVRETKRYYDSLALGSVSKGNETKTEEWKADSTYVNVQRAFNTYGLVASSTDPRGKVTTNIYDSLNLYVATSTNPLSQTTQFYYDYSLGKPKQVIDPNGRVFETVYDALDRPVTEKQPDLASPSTLVNKKTYAYTDTVGSRKVLETNYLDGSTDFTLYTYLDGFDRKIQTRKEAETTSEFAVKDFFYNTVGLLQKESLPYFSSGSSKTSATTSTALFTNYLYDPLKRVTAVGNVVGTTTTAYDQWTTTVTDPLSNYKDLTYDAYGNLTTVVEHDDANSYTTAYTYDRADNLTKITDADGSIRNFTYNGLKQRLTAEDLHDTLDGTFGTWTYGYDDAGNIASTTNPKSQIVNFTYDDLNRVLTEDFTGQAGTEVSYAYDSCTEGVGRLCVATSTGAVMSYAYNVLGLPASETKKVSNTNYANSYTYDRQKNLTLITYPDSSQARYTYNTAGLLETIAQKENGGAFADLVSDLDYAPTEKVKFKQFSNTVYSEYTYDADELYRLRKIFTVASTTGGGEGFMGGGEIATSGNFWSNLAKAVRYSPLAQLVLEATPIADGGGTELSTTTPTDTLPIDETVVVPSIEENIATSTEPVITPIAETATTTEPVLTSNTESATTTPLFVEESLATLTELIATSTVELATSTDPVATSTEAVPASILGAIEEMLVGKSADERATIKGQELAKITFEWRVQRGAYEIEIVSSQAIENGVEMFARAWDKNGPVGFGYDGSVEIERFRFFNPPILVDDPQGTIVRSGLDRDGKLAVRKLREDPREALLQALEHTISIVGKNGTDIKSGKVGNTTDTFYPDANPETYTTDGRVSKNDSNDWATVHDAAAGNSAIDDGSVETDIARSATTGGAGSNYYIIRGFLYFKTSTIGATEVIDSATLSVYSDTGVDNGDNDGQDYINVVRVQGNSVSSDTGLTTADYDLNGDAVSNPTKGSVDKDLSTFVTAAYNSFTMNATGRGWVARSGESKPGTAGITYLGLREGHDIENAAIAGGTSNSFIGYFADQTGSTKDPKLVVEHHVETLPAGTGLQNLTFTYDSTGNVTRIVDDSNTVTQRTTDFSYDDLYRLTTASTSAATSTPFSHTYAYSKLGNIASTTTKGAYAYAETDYANPHAPTSINGNTLSYDENGNLTSYLSTTYTWDYQNRLTKTASTTNTLFDYDHTLQRVAKGDGTATTTYPSKYYNLTSATTTKHIFTPDGDMIATITTTGATTTAQTQYLHTDHLGSTNVVTNSSGTAVQTTDYYPYGTSRISSGTGATDRRFIGERYDPETTLNYLNARYLDNSRGQFDSQDPVFWEVGQTSDGLAVLRMPQLQNSYSYAGNNPIKDKDPQGRLIDTIADLGFIAYDLYRVGAAYFGGGDARAELGYLGLDVVGAATPFATGFGATTRAVNIANRVSDTNSVMNTIQVGRAEQARLGFPNVKTGSAGGDGAGGKFPNTVRVQENQRTSGTCVFCGNKTTNIPGPLQFQLDHSIPKSFGGNTRVENAQTTCRTCNLQKGANTSTSFIDKIKSGIINIKL